MPIYKLTKLNVCTNKWIYLRCTLKSANLKKKFWAESMYVLNAKQHRKKVNEEKGYCAIKQKEGVAKQLSNYWNYWKQFFRTKANEYTKRHDQSLNKAIYSITKND